MSSSTVVASLPSLEGWLKTLGDGTFIRDDIDTDTDTGAGAGAGAGAGSGSGTLIGDWLSLTEGCCVGTTDLPIICKALRLGLQLQCEGNDEGGIAGGDDDCSADGKNIAKTHLHKHMHEYTQTPINTYKPA